MAHFIEKQFEGFIYTLCEQDVVISRINHYNIELAVSVHYNVS